MEKVSIREEYSLGKEVTTPDGGVIVFIRMQFQCFFIYIFLQLIYFLLLLFYIDEKVTLKRDSNEKYFH